MWKMSTWNALKANWNFINSKIIAFDWCITMLVISWRVERSSVWSAVFPLAPCHSLKVKRSAFQLKRGKSCQSRKYRASRRGIRKHDAASRGRRYSMELKRRMSNVDEHKRYAMVDNISAYILTASHLLCMTQCRLSRHSWPPRGILTVLIVLKSDLNHRD